MHKRIALAALSVAALSSGAFAQAFTYNGTGGAIPDQVGTTPGSVSFDIVVGDTGTISTFDNITLQARHTWVGDLIFTLTHVDTGTTVTFMERVGKTSPTAGAGDESNLGTGGGSVLATYTFNNTPSTVTSANSIWQAATLGTSAFDIPAGTYNASGNAFGGTAATSYISNTFSAFVGQSITGTWRFNVTDNAGADVGAIGAWSINGTLSSAAAPEPGSLALLGLVALPGVAILRRKK